MESDAIRVSKLDEQKEFEQSGDASSRLALDIGGSLIKIVYLSSGSDLKQEFSNEINDTLSANGNLNYAVQNGRLHFLKFETSNINECVKFVSSNCLGNYGDLEVDALSSDKNVKATGGGAFKFADLFKEKLGIVLDKVDEMNCLVAGANFVLETVRHEAFTYMSGKKEYVDIDHKNLYPYLLVSVGSGVGMIKVDGNNEFERVSGTSIGGGTFWGLGKLLTKCKSFDELLELSHKGNNRAIDMLVGDIYGGLGYSKVLTSTTIASTFGKAISEDKELEDYRAEDLARSLLRMISNNVGQVAYLNATHFGLRRIVFGGHFIQDHAFTMDTISAAVDFWSKGDAKALFLCHEGFLGALGAFSSYEKNEVQTLH